MENSEVSPNCSEEEYCLHLSSNKIGFHGVSKSGLFNVCFDETNIQVFSIASGTVTEVEVRSPFTNFCKTFKLEEKGRVISITFSPDQKILALQRTTTTIELFTFKDGKVDNEFSQSFKGCSLLGFMWFCYNELIVVTNVGIKLLKIDPNTKTVVNLKSLNINISWYTYYSPSNLLLVKVVEQGNPVQLLQVKQNKIIKSAKFDLYGDTDFKGKNVANTDRDDVILGVIYNTPRILFVNYRATNSNLQAEVIVRTFIDPSTVKITNVLRIDQGGRFGLNIVDNLIIVHNQLTRSSLIFDITDAKFNGVVTSDQSVVEPMSMKPFIENQSTEPKSFELYSPNWVIFQPNIIMDVKAGSLWGLEINLAGLYKHFRNKKDLIKFLILRKNSETLIGKMLLEIAIDPSRLEELSDAFYHINCVYRNFLELSMKSQIGLAVSSKQEEEPAAEQRTVFDQNCIEKIVFSKLLKRVSPEDKTKSKLLTWFLLEYIRSLSDFQIPPEHFIYVHLIKSLIMNDDYYQLHQLLQYHVIADSKPLACLLLSLKNSYPAASQLAIDMLERIGSAKEEIAEILLSDHQVLSCLRYATQRAEPNVRIKQAKYIEAAIGTSNPKLYHSIVNHFDKLHLSNGM